jgi:hypothetical protein
LSKGASARERTSSPSEADTLHALSSTRHLHHGICVCRSVALLFNLLARPTAPTATACLFRHKGMKERVRWRDVGTMLPRVLVAVCVFTQAKARAWTLTFTFNFLLFFTALCGALVRLNCVAAPTHSCCCPSLLEPSLPWSACLPLAPLYSLASCENDQIQVFLFLCVYRERKVDRGGIFLSHVPARVMRPPVS